MRAACRGRKESDPETYNAAYLFSAHSQALFLFAFGGCPKPCGSSKTITSKRMMKSGQSAPFRKEGEWGVANARSVLQCKLCVETWAIRFHEISAGRSIVRRQTKLAAFGANLHDCRLAMDFQATDSHPAIGSEYFALLAGLKCVIVDQSQPMFGQT